MIHNCVDQTITNDKRKQPTIPPGGLKTAVLPSFPSSTSSFLIGEGRTHLGFVQRTFLDAFDDTLIQSGIDSEHQTNVNNMRHVASLSLQYSPTSRIIPSCTPKTSGTPSMQSRKTDQDGNLTRLDQCLSKLFPCNQDGRATTEHTSSTREMDGKNSNNGQYGDQYVNSDKLQSSTTSLLLESFIRLIRSYKLMKIYADILLNAQVQLHESIRYMYEARVSEGKGRRFGHEIICKGITTSITNMKLSEIRFKCMSSQYERLNHMLESAIVIGGIDRRVTEALYKETKIQRNTGELLKTIVESKSNDEVDQDEIAVHVDVKMEDTKIEGETIHPKRPTDIITHDSDEIRIKHNSCSVCGGRRRSITSLNKDITSLHCAIKDHMQIPYHGDPLLGSQNADQILEDIRERNWALNEWMTNLDNAVDELRNHGDMMDYQSKVIPTTIMKLKLNNVVKFAIGIGEIIRMRGEDQSWKENVILSKSRVKDMKARKGRRDKLKMALMLLVNEEGRRTPLTRKNLGTIMTILDGLGKTSPEGMVIEGILLSKDNDRYTRFALPQLLSAEQAGCDHPLLYFFIGTEYSRAYWDDNINDSSHVKAVHYYEKSIESTSILVFSSLH